MTHAAALGLKVEQSMTGHTLALTHPDPLTVVWRAAVRVSDTNTAKEGLRATLEKIHDIAGNALNLTPAESAATVDALLSMAPSLAYGLFRGQPLALLYDVARLRAPGALDPAVPARVVEVHTPSDFAFPFELLPWQLSGNDAHDPAIRIRRLLGMSAVVRRKLDDEQRAALTSIANSPTLPVTIFCHAGLVAASEEADYLRKFPRAIDPHGPWPKPSRGLAPGAVVQHLLDSRKGVDGTPRDEPAGVLHLACHCDTEKVSVNDHTIDLGCSHGQVHYADLIAYASTPDAWSARRPRPLVFLNACGSAAPQVADRTSFIQFFIDQEFVGVLGTLCDISDTVAAHFATLFYEALLLGRTVGEAMYDARWHLMDRHHNPLGLLYTYHGNPDLRLATSRAGSVIPTCTAAALRS